MKILSVKFSNLNSLRDEVDIDFVEGPLGAAGLFAITGPTGSGKSTILDAISLALYNSTARDQRHEIISRGSRKAESTVEFELKGKVYRSTWSMRLSKPRTEGKSPTGTGSMELAVVSGSPDQEDEIIGDMLRGDRGVPAMVEALTGLNFSRFTQSMLLAQGQFDAFLIAPTKDRSDLLEQITGTQIYSDVSKLVFDRHKVLNSEVKVRKEELAKRGVPDEEQITKLREEESILSLTVAEQLKPIKLLRETHQAHIESADVQAQVRTLAIEEKAYLEAETHRKQVKSKLDANLRAQPLVVKLRDLDRIKKEKETLDNEVAHSKGVLPKLKEKKSSQEADDASAKTIFKTAQEELQQARLSSAKLKDLSQVLKKAKLAKDALSVKLSDQHAQQVKLKSQQEELKFEQEGLDKLKIDLDKQVESLSGFSQLEKQLPLLREKQQEFVQQQQASNQLKRSLNEAVAGQKLIEAALVNLGNDAPTQLKPERYTSSNPEEVVEQLSSELEVAKDYTSWLGDFGGKLKSYLDDAAIFKNRQSAFSQQQKSLAEAQEVLLGFRKDKSLQDSKLEELTTSEKLAKEAFEAIKLTAELQATHLHRLVDGEPCPLCGALEHPALKEMAEVKPASHEAVWQSAKATLQKFQVEAEAFNQKVAAQEVRVAELTDANKSEEIQAEKARITARAGVLEEEYTKKKPGKALALETASLDALRGAWKKSDDRQRALQVERAEVQVLAKAWTVYNQELKTQQARLKDQKERVAALGNQFKVSEEKLSLSEKALKSALDETQLELPSPLPGGYVDNLQVQVDAYKKAKSTLELTATKQAASSKELSQLIEQLGLLQKSIVQVEKEAAEQRADLTRSLDLQKKLLCGFEDEETLIASFMQVFAKAEMTQATLSKELAATTKEIEVIELQQVERQKRIKSLSLELSTLSESLQVEIVKRKFDSIDQAFASLLSEAEQEALQSEMDKAARLQASLETRRKSLDERSKSLAVKLDKQPEAAKVASQLSALEEEHAKAQVTLGGARKELKRALDDRKVMERDAAEVAKQEDELADWTTLNKLIGSATGSSFREYAQRVTLKQLIAYANEYLKEFYPRFSVSSGDAQNNDPLEIFICDHYEADHVRKVATVSGGERFLVSMALALGFSRMASRNISIDTLFIDEGFGTLDGETLDKAIQALEKLQQRGKTIGIISHVASLQERIGAQIRLVRQSSGRSKVEVIG